MSPAADATAMPGARRLRALAHHARRTLLHPQWIAFRHEAADLVRWAAHCRGLVLDVGSGRQRIRPLLDANCRYLGVDYYATSTALYAMPPGLYADARALPLGDGCADTVLLLEVLEHVPEPERAVAEACRVLRPGGMLVVSVPFLYPVHDAPYDFQRWTPAGVRGLAARHGFEVIEARCIGAPAETVALLANIGLAHSVLRLLRWSRIAGALALAPVALTIALLNVLGWIGGRVHGDRAFMPHSCHIVCRKPDGRA